MKLKFFIGTVLVAGWLGVVSATAQTSSATQQVLESTALTPGLVWLGNEAPGESESAELLAVLASVGQVDWLPAAEKFLQRHPQSAWAAALRHDCALACQRAGRTTRALEQWDAAWALVKADSSAAGQKLAGSILANWMNQLASLGRLEKLQELVAAGDGLHFVESADRDQFQGAKNSCYRMAAHPGIAFRCGTLALKAVGIRLRPGDAALEYLPSIPSPSGGFTLAMLLDLAQQYQLPLAAVRSVRTTNGEPKLIVPSVVHWRVDHYAAILEQRGSMYLVGDPTFGEDRWLTADTIREEAGGEFLVPTNLVTKGWQELTRAEAKAVHGMGLQNSLDDGKDKSCVIGKPCPECVKGKGMPVWWVSEPYINLWMADEPVSYRLASGKVFTLRLTYKQRDTRAGVFPTGRGWNNSWNSYITTSVGTFDCNTNNECSLQGGGVRTLYLPTGGTVTFQPGQTYDAETRLLLIPQYPTATVPTGPTVDAGGNGYRLVHADGSQDIYGFGTSAYYLSRRLDTDGDTTWINRGTNSQVTAVVDPDGRTNVLTYNANNLLTQVTTPDGLTAKFKYDAAGNLTNLTDAQGLVSSLTYDTNNFPTQLVTPYGTNTFVSYVNAAVASTNNGQGNFGGHELVDRALQGTDPTGATSLWLYRYDSPPVSNLGLAGSFAANEVPVGTPLGKLDDGSASSTNDFASTGYRNSFFWGPRQLAGLSTTNFLSFNANDYVRGRLRHWLQDTNDLTLSGALSVERAPSPDGTTEGLKMFYDYQGKTLAHRAGTNAWPAVVAWRLPGGETHYEWSRYDYFGNVTNVVTTATRTDGSLGTRTNQFRYAANVYTYSLNSISRSFTVPNLLTQVIGADGQTLWSAGGFEAVTWTNYFYADTATNFARLTSSRIHPSVFTNAVGETATATWSGGTLLTNYNVVNANRPVTGWSFTRYNQLTSFKSFSGLTTTNLYDANGYLTQTIDLETGRTNSFGYTSNGLVSTFTNELSLNLALTWDNLLRLTRTVFPDGTDITNRFDRLDLGGTRDRQGNWTSYGHDGARHLTSMTNANNAVTRYQWCGCGALESVLDALTNVTTLSYDLQGRQTGVNFPDGSTLTYQLDLAGRVTNVFDNATRTLRLAYNHQGLVTNVSDALNFTRQSVGYDGRDRAFRVTDENGVTVTNQFDALNRLLARTWPDGVGESFGYNAQGLFAYTNRNNQVTTWLRDVAGRTLAETNANLEVTQFSYNPADEILTLTDGLQHTRSWAYNQYGWETNKTDGLSRTIFRYGYNANGWLTNRWTPEKGNVGYQLDNVGNVLTLNYQLSTLNYAYDLLNRLTNVVDATGTSKFAWNAVGELLSEDGPWANDAVSYTYTNGLRTKLTITQPGTNWTQTYAYDKAWRMTNTTSLAGGFLYRYQLSSLISQLSLPNGATITNTYDTLARLRSTALNDHWGHTLDGYAYQLDTLGLRTNLTRNFGLGTNAVNVGYDNINQITSWNARENDGTARRNEQLGWTYDAANNLLRRTNNFLVQSFTVNAADELNGIARNGTFTEIGATPVPMTVTVNGQAAQTYEDLTFASTNLSLVNGVNTFTNIAVNFYGVKATNKLTANLPVNVTLSSDANGNLTNDGVRTFGWDVENQLTNVTLPGVWKKDFVFDGLNRMRIKRDYIWTGSAWSKTNETRFIWDGNVIMQLRDANNVPVLTLTRGLDFSGSLQGAGGIGGLLAMTDASDTLYYHSDGSGNVTALMDGREQVLGRREYDAFGKSIFYGGRRAGANPFWFSSQFHDEQADTYHYLYRVYSPNLQRWLNNDPIEEAGGINLTGFVGNDSVNWIDPLGLQKGGSRPTPRMSPGNAGRAPSLNPNGTRRPRSAEEIAEDSAEQMAGREANRQRGRDPNGTYLDPAPGPTRPMTEAEREQAIRDAVNDFNTMNNNCPLIYRGGGASPSNLKPRPEEEFLSFRDSLSNPLPNTGRPVFRPGDKYIGIDPSKLPPNSVIYDNAPPGHVSVRALPTQTLQDAISESAKFPK